MIRGDPSSASLPMEASFSSALEQYCGKGDSERSKDDSDTPEAWVDLVLGDQRHRSKARLQDTDQQHALKV
jgi:hypothetical protein